MHAHTHTHTRNPVSGYGCIVFTQAFYLVAGSYQQVTKGTEMRQRALDIFWTFFIENSVSVHLIPLNIYNFL